MQVALYASVAPSAPSASPAWAADSNSPLWYSNQAASKAADEGRCSPSPACSSAQLAAMVSGVNWPRAESGQGTHGLTVSGSVGMAVGAGEFHQMLPLARFEVGRQAG